ncbi:MAG: rhamnulose-1-phosphate aldolase, partial [Bacillus sp. (in: firmicutes)]
MSDSILQAPFMFEIINACSTIYQVGWGENHAGNLSYRLTEKEIETYIDKDGGRPGCEYKLERACPQLGNEYFLVTASGSPFKNVKHNPDIHLGIIQINEEGSAYKVIWGFREGRKPT